MQSNTPGNDFPFSLKESWLLKAPVAPRKWGYSGIRSVRAVVTWKMNLLNQWKPSTKVQPWNEVWPWAHLFDLWHSFKITGVNWCGEGRSDWERVGLWYSTVGIDSYRTCSKKERSQCLPQVPVIRGPTSEALWVSSLCHVIMRSSWRRQWTLEGSTGWPLTSMGRGKGLS